MSDVNMSELFQSDDWKQEKHVPVIEVEKDAEKKGRFNVRVQVGKEISHPNKTEHHIRWIKTLFLPEGGKFPYELGVFEFNSHGASVKGPDTSGVYTPPDAHFSFDTDKPGTLIAFSLCNIHGLWKNTTDISL